MSHYMHDKFFDLKGDAIEERKERRKLGQISYYGKLKHQKGYIVWSYSKEVYEKLYPKIVADKQTEEK